MKFDIVYFVVKEGLFLLKYEKFIVLEKRYGVLYGIVYCIRIVVIEFMLFQVNEVFIKLI